VCCTCNPLQRLPLFPPDLKLFQSCQELAVNHKRIKYRVNEYFPEANIIVSKRKKDTSTLSKKQLLLKNVLGSQDNKYLNDLFNKNIF